jgi:DNA-binding NtrC family response regulator
MSGGEQSNELRAREQETTTRPAQPSPVQPSPVQPGTAPGDRPGPAGRKARILIVEDEPWDAELAQRLLTSAGLGFTAVVVDTRVSFVQQLAAFRPDVILSDFHLPGFSGETALEIAQEQCPEIPFIFWSGVLGDEAAVGLIKKGATDYVLKDRPARLPSVIYRALAEAEQRAQLAKLEDQLREAQRLASLGQLAAAEDAVRLTRRLLAVTRQVVTTGEPQSRPVRQGTPD